MNILRALGFPLIGLASIIGAGRLHAAEAVEQIHALTEDHPVPVILRKGESISTKLSFRPPVEITITAKVDERNLIIGYAADKIIFNWDGSEPTQLRVEGGPASGKHKTGAGSIPINRYVEIRWTVTADKQSISVDGGGRWAYPADYSTLNRPITVSATTSRVTVRSIKVKAL